MMNDIQHVAADPLDGISQTLDRAAAVGIAHLTHGLSPVTMVLAATDWMLHLASAPGKQLQLGAKAARKYWRLSDYIGRSLNDRSEEHTSELQSLMRLSYAVFSLKKKTTQQ